MSLESNTAIECFMAGGCNRQPARTRNLIPSAALVVTNFYE